MIGLQLVKINEKKTKELGMTERLIQTLHINVLCEDSSLSSLMCILDFIGNVTPYIVMYYFHKMSKEILLKLAKFLSNLCI